ncbi:c-type cytochrome [Calothrix sp. 336/3]|uniref:c-type cytochrome n=1 Tax=Calothrix sp. 336/3 TaxID=1337936 RepID=UPI0004E383FD|nr:c-type cytochrome [Calothrix sp. 336/3]AKG24855.1 cytochrome C6 [Calothrix sp. 336/3]
MKKLLILIIISLTIWTTYPVKAVFAIDTVKGGEQIFEFHCAGCHINGSNIIRRGKNLKLPALKKYGMDSIAAVTEIVTNGKNNMSAYKDKLTVAEIEDVSNYVLEQAAKGWK